MEKQSPLISVIMPLYNAERFVGESIGNILGQTVGDFELIVIDDASTDSSYDIASRYAAQDARIVLMRNDANHGAAYTRNRGLETARGSFITFMDADDRCSPERFARQTAFFGQHPQIDLCGSYYTMFGPDDAREQKIQDPITHEGIRIQMPSCARASGSGRPWRKTTCSGRNFPGTCAWPTSRNTSRSTAGGKTNFRPAS